MDTCVGAYKAFCWSFLIISAGRILLSHRHTHTRAFSYTHRSKLAMPQHCNQETSSSDCPTTPSKAPSCPNTEAPLLPLPVSHTILTIDRSKFSMACIQDTSSDGSSKAAPWPPAAAPPLVPCCNGNCRLLGCPGTTNLCSKCYADSLRDEGTLSRAEPLDGVSGVVPAIQSSDKPQELNFCADAIESTADVQDLKEEVPSPLRLSPPVLEQVEAAALLLPASAPCEQIVKIVNRCLTCRKRVGLLGFKCKCGGVFCALHRYSDKHNCSFDYKAAGRAVIARENPVVIASKIERI